MPFFDKSNKRAWGLNTPNNGNYFNKEFSQLYDNTEYLKAEVDANDNELVELKTEVEALKTEIESNDNELENLFEFADMTRKEISNISQIIATNKNYDYVVENQEDFNNLFTRTSANVYDIRPKMNLLRTNNGGKYTSQISKPMNPNDINNFFYIKTRSVYLKNIEGGYKVSKILSDGDSWGNLYTNDSVLIVMEAGAFIDFENLLGGFVVNTDDCILKNVYIKGEGTATTFNNDDDVFASFTLAAHRVVFDNCKVSDRLYSSKGCVHGFLGSNLLNQNMTSKYINCSVFNLVGDGEETSGFKACMNLVSCNVSSILGTAQIGGGFDFYFPKIIGFDDCKNIINSNAYDILSDNQVKGFYNCENISNSYISNISSNNSNADGFVGCFNLTGCIVENIGNVLLRVFSAFQGCSNLSACQVRDIIVMCENGTVIGFGNCSQVSGCSVNRMKTGNHNTGAVAFSTCYNVSACNANTIETNNDIHYNNCRYYGFSYCNRISACCSSGIDPHKFGVNRHAFVGCKYGSALSNWGIEDLDNTNNDYIDTSNGNITNRNSCQNIWK